MATTINENARLHSWEGIYEPTEAASYLKASARSEDIVPFDSTKLIRWIRRGLANPELVEVPGRDILIDFEDLISMRVISTLKSAGMNWPAIYEAEKWLREMTGLRQPFATESLWAGQGDVFTEWGDRLVSGNRRGQTGLELIRKYLIPIHGLVFHEESHRAASWEPAQDVLLQPAVQFGAPCVKGTRIPTKALMGMIEAGDSEEWVAQSYNLSVSTVRAACDWESRIQSQ